MFLPGFDMQYLYIVENCRAAIDRTTKQLKPLVYTSVLARKVNFFFA